MTKLETLVFSGGGLRGISYTGIIRLIDEYNLRKDIKHIIGSSIGAMAALYMILKYSYDDVMDVVLNFSMKQIQDINVNTILKAPATYGIDSGKKFIEFYKSLITRKGYSVDITLKEIFILTGIKFTVVTTCIEECKAYYMNYENEPDMPLWKACLMSSNVPFIFPPFEYNGKHYIDGGLIDNFPLQYLDETPGKGLGVILNDSLSGNELSSASNYVMTIFKCYNHTNNLAKFKKYETNLITIIVNNIKFYEAEIDKQQLNSLVLAGYEQMKERIKAFAEAPDIKIDVKSEIESEIESEKDVKTD